MPLYKQPKSPYWWVRIGRKTRRSTGTADRAAAEEFERKLTEQIWRQQKLGDRGGSPWREAAQRWLSEDAKPKKRDREVLAFLDPIIGDDSVADVAHPDALAELRKEALAERGRPGENEYKPAWSHATVDRVMATVSSVLHKCEEWRWIEHAPSVPMYRPGTDEPRHLTPEEFERLCAELPKHLELAARFGVLTLLRMRAMLQLTWDRVDIERRVAWVPRRHQKANRTFGLPLSREAIKVLQELKNYRAAEEADHRRRCLRLGLKPTAGDDGHVFTYKRKPIDDCNGRAFQEALKRAGIEGANWHSLRHTGASWAVQAGVSLQELMVLGDWKSYQMVLRYAHLAPSQAAAAAERVAGMSHTAKNRPNTKKVRIA